MINPLIALLLPSLLIVPAMGLLSRVRSSSLVGAEIRRKALHVSVGLFGLSFPLLLREPGSIVVALVLVVAWMLAVRFVPALSERFGCVLHGAGRASWGEIWFAVSIALLLLSPWSHAVLYAVPLLILTLSDAAAAIVGRAWPLGRWPAPLSGKTLSGSAAFFGSAFCMTTAALAFATDLGAVTILLTSLAVSGLTTLTEAVSSRGFDNFSVPAVAWLILISTLNG
jgi:phytol kinase